MAKCYLYDIINPEPGSLSKDQWRQLAEIMASSGWAGRQGKRIGFVQVQRSKNTIGGFFANEGQKRGVQYDEKKEPRPTDPYYSFEHLFFVLFEDTAQLLLQSIRAYDYADLGMKEMRDNFLGLLADHLRMCRVYVAGASVIIEPAGARFSQEQMYIAFRTAAQVSEIEITDLRVERIPSPGDPKYQLFNPKDEWHPITWGAVRDTIAAGTDAVKISARDQPDSTIQAPIPKALAAIGQIERLSGRDSEGRVFIRQRTQDLELEVELPPQAMLSPDLIGNIVERLDARGRTESWSHRQALRQDELNRNTLLDCSG